MDHTVLPAITQCLPLPRKRSPDGTSTDWGGGHVIATYYSFIYPRLVKGRVGLVGWPTVDSLPRKWSPVSCRTGKVCRSKTDVLARCYTTITSVITEQTHMNRAQWNWCMALSTALHAREIWKTSATSWIWSTTVALKGPRLHHAINEELIKSVHLVGN